MENLIQTEGLAKRYDGFALQDIALAVPVGTVVGLIGSNGAGKTTTLKMVLGMLEPDGGTVRLLGRDPSGKDIDALKQQVGVVLDTCSFPETMTVGDAGALGRIAYNSWDRRRFADLCTAFGLEQGKGTKALSRGMGMKLSLAFALAHHPRLLVLDEATAGLDPLARDEVLDLLRQYMEGGDRGILISTHITSDLEKIADEVVCIDDGRLVFDLPKDAICDAAGVARCRTADLEAIAASGFMAPEDMLTLAHPYGTDLLVPDRFAFARAFPAIALDRASIEDYMALSLKGRKGGLR